MSGLSSPAGAGKSKLASSSLGTSPNVDDPLDDCSANGPLSSVSTNSSLRGEDVDMGVKVEAAELSEAAPKAPTKEVIEAEADFPLESLNTEKSAMLSSPSENLLVSVISYHPALALDLETEVGVNAGLSNVVDLLGSLIQDRNQCEAAAAVVSL